jgi:hypothetical protein
MGFGAVGILVAEKLHFNGSLRFVVSLFHRTYYRLNLPYGLTGRSRSMSVRTGYYSKFYGREVCVATILLRSLVILHYC